MSDPDVTHVTRNKRTLPPEVKLAVDLVASVAMIYYITHPDCLEKGREEVRVYWSKLMHRVSIWTTRQDIRSLPEVDE